MNTCQCSPTHVAGPPSAPANLKATPSTPATATVMWNPTSAGITRYEYRYGPVGFPDSKMTAGYVGPSSTLVELNDLIPGEEYVIRVTSVNTVGQSDEVSTTWTQPTPPPPPEGMSLLVYESSRILTVAIL